MLGAPARVLAVLRRHAPRRALAGPHAVEGRSPPCLLAEMATAAGSGSRTTTGPTRRTTTARTTRRVLNVTPTARARRPAGITRSRVPPSTASGARAPVGSDPLGSLPRVAERPLALPLVHAPRRMHAPGLTETSPQLHSSVAQSVEHPAVNRMVAGSSPALGANMRCRWCAGWSPKPALEGSIPSPYANPDRNP